VQTKLAFHYVSSDVPYFPFVLSHLSSCFLSASQCKLSVMISSSCRHHDSLTISIHFIPPFLALCWHVVFLFSQSLVLWLCCLVLFFPHPRAPTFCACRFSRQLWQEISTSYWFEFQIVSTYPFCDLIHFSSIFVYIRICRCYALHSFGTSSQLCLSLLCDMFSPPTFPWLLISFCFPPPSHLYHDQICF